jgi:hypothetical protein
LPIFAPAKPANLHWIFFLIFYKADIAFGFISGGVCHYGNYSSFFMAKVKKTRKEKAPPEPFWNEMVAVWFNFCEEKFNEKPTFDGSAPRDLKGIVSTLRTRAEKSGLMWSLSLAQLRLKNFLLFAYQDSEWLRKNWLLSNLNRQKDSIFFNLAKSTTK